jgi:hypothetical protein
MPDLVRTDLDRYNFNALNRLNQNELSDFKAITA